MLLQKWREYSNRLDLPPRLYSELAVRYIIELDSDGRFLGLIDTADRATPRTRRGQLRLVPEVRRTSGPRALLLCDKADYVLGYVAEGANKARVAEAHRLFVDLTRRCAEVSDDMGVAGVLSFLENNPLDQITLPPDVAPTDRITFRIDGRFPVDEPSVQRFWASQHSGNGDESDALQCVVCGHHSSTEAPAERHPRRSRRSYIRDIDHLC
jgi:CRISPR-associated protein Csd1